jgi:hypothetical protein
MLQSKSFSGQPVFSQITGLINKASFSHLVKHHDADRYCKLCGAWEHFICVLYCSANALLYDALQSIKLNRKR